MDFDAVAALTRGVPHMGEREARKLYDHVRRTRPAAVLEIGTAHGVSGCYIAAALEENGTGRLTTVDHVSAGYTEPSADELFAKAGLQRWIDRRLIDDSSYTWWLKRQIEERTGADGRTQPAYDLCFLDGAHNWTIDGLAAVLVERLLKPGGWLLLDDLDWTYAGYGGDIELSPPSDKMHPMSEDELRTPHVGAVVDVILKGHPAFDEIRIEDERWAWCRKGTAAVQQVRVETTRPLPVLVSLAAQRSLQQARALLSRRGA